MTDQFIIRQIKLSLTFYILFFLLIWCFSSKTDIKEIALFSLADLLIIMVPQWFGLAMSLYVMKRRRLKVRLMSHQEWPPHWAIGAISFAALFRKSGLITRLHLGKIVYSKGLPPINVDKLRVFYGLSGIVLIVTALTWPYLYFFAVEKVKFSGFTISNLTAAILVSGLLCGYIGWNWLWKKDDIKKYLNDDYRSVGDI